jgi:hypothetical protein
MIYVLPYIYIIVHTFTIIIIHIVFSLFSATELTDNYNVTKLLTMIILQTYLQKTAHVLIVGDCT